MILQDFVEETQVYNQPGEVRADCNAITFLNVGTAQMQVNGVLVVPGAQLVSTGNEGEINRTRYRLSFAGVGTEICQVIRKVYQ